MSRWVFVAVSFQLACLQTEAVELSPEASGEVETRDESEALAEALETMAPQACLSVAPAGLSFGGKLVGATSVMVVSVVSCGDTPLVVSAIALSDDAEGQFSVLGLHAPVTLAPGQALAVEVTYFPSQIAPVDANNQPVRTTSSLVITSNAPAGELSVPIDGYGVHATCPTAVIGVAEGDEVPVATLLTLDGSQSSSPNGAIVAYEWTVTQPSGSSSLLLPSASVASPIFEANVVGGYLFELTVIDALGVRSCTPAVYQVWVAGQHNIHVEVIWDTPGDADQSDTSTGDPVQGDGSDVDLHFLSPNANGQLNHSIFDCNYANPKPEWGAPGADGDPHLDRDDSDGAGPENLNVDSPEDGARYQVSVHYFDDWGFGDSTVKVRIYIAGILRDEWSTNLTMDDQWDSHYIDWPSGVVTRIGSGTPQITPNSSGNND